MCTCTQLSLCIPGILVFSSSGVILPEDLIYFLNWGEGQWGSTLRCMLPSLSKFTETPKHLGWDRIIKPVQLTCMRMC